MARITHDQFSGSDSQSGHSISVDGQDHIDVPGKEFVSDATMTRDGYDLVLDTPHGQSLTIEGYFQADPAPDIVSPDGSVLTPQLVDSFVHMPAQYAQVSTMTDESPVGAIDEVKGEATIIHPDGTSETATIGTPVYAGDIIETNADGAANIVFIDETNMAVSNNARLAIDDYSFDPTTESGTTNFSVLRGVFMFTSGLIGRDDPDDVQIDTPVGSIGIRGTIIAGDINPGGESEITVIEGAIVVKNGVAEKTLAVQFESIKLAGFDQPMQDMGALDANQVTKNYGSVSEVSPTLFSSLNDAAKEQNGSEYNVERTGEDGQDQTPDGTDSSDDSQQLQDGSETGTSDGTNDAGSTGDSTQPAPDDGTVNPDGTNPDGTQQDSLLQTDQPLLQETLSGDPLQTGTMDGTLKTSPTGTLDATKTTTLQTTTQDTTTTTQTTTTTTSSTTTTLVDPKVLGTAPPPPAGTSPPPPLNLNTATLSTNKVSRIGDNAGHKIGHSISALGDVNHDGYADFAFTNNIDGQNHTYVVYGKSGGVASGNITSLQDGLIVSLNDPDANPGDLAVIVNPWIDSVNDTSRSVVSGIGDFDGDGVQDYLVGQGMSDGTQTASGQAYIVSGANPNDYITIDGTISTSQLGETVTGVGDINNDGYDDVLIGAPNQGAGGAAYLVYGGMSGWSSTVNAPGMTGQGQIYNGATGDELGQNISMIGDFDGDGYSDFAIGATKYGAGDNGRVSVYFGNNPSVAGLTLNGDFPGQNLGPVEYAGDFNGDGRSDFIVAGDNPDGAGFYDVKLVSYNGSITQSTLLHSSYEIVNGGAVGDWNGDGYDDFAVALKTYTGASTYNADIYIVYGKDGTTPNYVVDPANGINQLNNVANAYHMTYTGITNGTDVELSSAGDVNGDGYDDLAIGVESAYGGNGEVLVVNGRGAGGKTLMNNSAQDLDTSTNIRASADGQSWVLAPGNSGFYDNGFWDQSVRGGAGDNTITINNGNFNNIDGGQGNDTLRWANNVGGTLDLTNFNYEEITQIEKLQYAQNGTTIMLSVENIFNLLKTSDTGELKIELDGANGVTNGTLHIVSGIDYADDPSGVVSALNDMSTGTASTSTASGFNQFDIGGYTLYIDNNITLNVQP